MTTLMVYKGPASADAAVTRTGGVPLVPDEFSWPRCRACEGLMTFLAQVMPGGVPAGGRQRVLSVFMCGNDPGMCGDWEPAAGGNRAVVFPLSGLRPATVPDAPGMLLGEVSAVEYVTEDGDYDQACGAWAEQERRPVTDVLGQVGGQPSWIQGDETPACPQCARPMGFTVQLEEGHDYRTEMNFGGRGCGYGFTCCSCDTAAFLWQC